MMKFERNSTINDCGFKVETSFLKR